MYVHEFSIEYLVFLRVFIKTLIFFVDMADPHEHATGLERKELDAIKKGNPVSRVTML